MAWRKRLVVLAWILGVLAGSAAVPTPPGGEQLDLYGDPLPPGARVRLGTVRYRHGSRGATFLADGRTVLAMAPGGPLHFWDAFTGRLVRSLDVAPVGFDQAFAVSGDRRRVL